MGHSLMSDGPLLDKLKHPDVFNLQTMGKAQYIFSQKVWGPRDLGARGLCPPSLYGCYATDLLVVHNIRYTCIFRHQRPHLHEHAHMHTRTCTLTIMHTPQHAYIIRSMSLSLSDAWHFSTVICQVLMPFYRPLCFFVRV